MAQPGEVLPLNFALGVLNLSQQIKQRNAELAEMRRARAAANFLEKERLRLAEQGQALQAQQAANAQALDRERLALQQQQLQLATQSAIEEARQRRERELQEALPKALNDFITNGTAFLPSEISGSATDQLRKTLSEDEDLFEIPLAGVGSFLIKTKGAETEAARRLREQARKSSLDAALTQARIMESEARAAKARAEIAQLSKAVTPNAAFKASSLINTYMSTSSKILGDLTSTLSSLYAERTRLQITRQPVPPELQKRITELESALARAQNDVTTLLPAEHQKVLSAAMKALLAGAQSAAERAAAGQAPFNPDDAPFTQPEIARALGIDAALSTPPHAVASQLDPETPWAHLPTNLVIRTSSRPNAPAARFYVDPGGTGLVPLDQTAATIAKSERLLARFLPGQRISPLAATLGWRPQPKPAPAPARAPAPAPPAPSKPVPAPTPAPAAAPDPRKEAERLVRLYKSNPPPEKKAQIIARLKQLRSALAPSQ